MHFFFSPYGYHQIDDLSVVFVSPRLSGLFEDTIFNLVKVRHLTGSISYFAFGDFLSDLHSASSVTAGFEPF